MNIPDYSTICLDEGLYKELAKKFVESIKRMDAKIAAERLSVYLIYCSPKPSFVETASLFVVNEFTKTSVDG